MQTAPETIRSKSLKYDPLPEEPRLAFAPLACLAARAIPEACRRCAAACPVAALRVEGSGPKLIRDCLGCGRCAAACPSGALLAQGFAGEEPLPVGNAATRVECWKVPAGGTKHAKRVPCLLGLRVEDLLEWSALAGGAPLVLIDRGWCPGCSAGGAGASLATVVEEARHLLAALGQDASVQVQREPLSATSRPESIPPAVAVERIGRRAFFQRLASQTAQALPSRRPAMSLAGRGRHLPLPRRERLLAVLELLATRPPLPATVLPQARVSSSCALHGLCAGLCPTGALRLAEDNGELALEHDPRVCVACGLCQRACPEGAINIERWGEPGVLGLPHRLAAAALRPCERCGKPWVAKGGARVCPACQRDLLICHQLFGTRVAKSETSSDDSLRHGRGEP